MDDFKGINWRAAGVNYRSAKYGSLMKPVAAPTIDQDVSKIVGKKVFTNDPRLIRLVIEEKQKKNPDNWDNFLHRPDFRKKLIEVFSPEKLNEQ